MAKRIALLTLFFSLTFFASAQTRSLGAIRGRVTDSTGAVVAGAKVTLTNSATGATKTVQTATDGSYFFSNLPLTGTYSITVDERGFSQKQFKDLDLRAGEAIRVDTVLVPAGKTQEIVVELDGDLGPPLLNTWDHSLSTYLDPQQIDNTPVFGRKASTLPLLDSAVRPARGTGDLFVNQTLIVINGSGRRQTTYSIDNATADDTWGRQAMFTTLPFSSIQEFTVLTNAASAEYGRTTGAAVNIVTKAGSNNFHGDLFGMFRPGDIQSRVPLAKVDSTDSLFQGGATLGGPIVRDSTWFLLSFEHTNQDRDSVITSPLAPGSVYTGTFEQNLFLTRLDHNFSDRSKLTVRANLDRFDDSNPADAVGGIVLPTAGRNFARKTYAAEVQHDFVFSPTIVNNARFQFQLGSPITQFVPKVPSTQFTRSGFATEGESRVANLMNHQYEFGDTVSWLKGHHDMRFGADVTYSSNGGFGQEFGGGFTLGQFTVNPAVTVPLSQITLADVTRYNQSFGNLNYNVRETLGSGFIQDNWTIRPHLTLNLGLRYEAQSLTDDHNNFAPRLGFAWQPYGDGPVFRGGYGIYYSEIRANIAAGYHIGGPQGIFNYTANKGAIGFPTSLAPLPAFPAGAPLPPRDITVNVGQADYLNQFFDVSKLRFYPDALLNPYTQQWNFGMQHELAHNTVLSLDYLGQRTLKMERPVDLNAPSPFIRTAPGQTRSGAAADATRPILPVNNGYKRIIANVNVGQASYNGLDVKLTTRGAHWNGLFTYTWSHTIGTVEADVPQQDPNDSNFLGADEKATSLLDQRHRVSVSGYYQFPWQITFGSWITAASGRPYNITTGVDNNGDGSNADRPVVNGVVIPRNFGRGTVTYDISSYIEKGISLTERFKLQLRAEGFNLTNHNNIVGRNGTFGNAASGIPNATLGAALGGINNTDAGREFQFMARLRF